MRFLPLGLDLELAAGARLLDALDEAAAALLPTACRAANCGLCLVRVRSGAELLAPPGRDEQAFCAGQGGGPDLRLGCQLRTASELGGSALVVLEILAASGADRRPRGGRA